MEVIPAIDLRGGEVVRLRQGDYDRQTTYSEDPLGVALAFAGNPGAVFLDEPTTGLDVEARRALWQAIQEYAREGSTVLLTTHHMEEAETLATRVVFTEYEANRRLLNLHDVCGAADGKIWYSSHHSPWVGYLDPKTGIIEEFRLPDVAGRPTIDTHACQDRG